MKKWKATIINYSTLAEMDDAIARLRALTDRQIAICLALTEQVAWKTRYDNPPTQDALLDLRAQLEDNLMAQIDICDEVETCLASSEIINGLSSGITNVSDRLNELEDELEEAPPDGNIYDPAPLPETDPACGSADYIFARLLEFAQEIELLPSTYFTPLQALRAMLLSPIKFSFAILRALILWIFSLPSDLSPALTANEDAIRNYLYCNGFDKSDFADFLDTIATGLGDYVRCLAPSTWDKWIATGEIEPLTICGCGTWSDLVETNSVSGDPFSVIVGTTQTTRVISAVLGTGRGLQVDVNFASAGFVDSLSILYRFDAVANHKLVRAEGFLGASLVASSEFFSTRTTLGYDAIGLASGTYDNIRITLQASLFATTGFAELDAVALEGTGANPF